MAEERGLAREELTELLSVAADLGLDVSERSIRRLIERKGASGARETLDAAAHFVDNAAMRFAIAFDYAAAAARLTWSDGDAERALARLGQQLERGEQPLDAERGRRLRAEAEDLGVHLGQTAANRLAARRRDANVRVRAVANVLDVASQLGLDVEPRSAWQMVVSAGGDAGPVIERLRRRGRRRAWRRSGRCGLRLPLRGTPREQDNMHAGCGCGACAARLAERLAPYTTTIVRYEWRATADRDEARQVAGLALMEALDDWTGEGDFAPYYGGAVQHRFAAAARHAAAACRGGGEQPLSLSWEMELEGGSRRVGLLERIPDRTCDTLEIVLMRARVWERVEKRRAVAHEGVERFERGL